MCLIDDILVIGWQLVSCPDPFRKYREGVWQHCHTMVCLARSVQYAPIRLQSSVTSRDRSYAQVGVVPFDIALIMSDVAGSIKLLLKQKEVAEAFTSERDAFINFLTSYNSTSATDAFPQHRYC